MPATFIVRSVTEDVDGWSATAAYLDDSDHHPRLITITFPTDTKASIGDRYVIVPDA